MLFQRVLSEPPSDIWADVSFSKVRRCVSMSFCEDGLNHCVVADVPHGHGDATNGPRGFVSRKMLSPACHHLIASHHINPDRNYWCNQQKNPGRWPGQSVTNDPTHV